MQRLMVVIASRLLLIHQLDHIVIIKWIKDMMQESITKKPLKYFRKKGDPIN